VSSLKREPPQPVQSIEELFAIAYVMDRDAANRYAEIARRLSVEGSICLAAVFERLATEGRSHLVRVVHWSEKESGKAPDPTRMRWEPTETFDDEGASTRDTRLLSSYQSLSMAVRNKERAFAFWTYVAAYAKDREVRRAAESMAGEQLDHVANLRRERRSAYHMGRAATPRRENLDASAEIAALERYLAQRLEHRAGLVQDAGATRLQEFAREARTTAEEVARVPLRTTRGLPHGASLLEEAATIAELLVYRYLEMVEDFDDEAALARMQALAGRAINRLAWLKAHPPEVEER